MEYQQSVGYEILRKMEQYKGAEVPSPHQPLDPDTGLPPRCETPSAPGIPLRGRSEVEMPVAPDTTHPQSWVGEMPVALFLQHTAWLKEEGFITTKLDPMPAAEYPKALKYKAVQLLKAVDNAGGWEEALAIAKESGALDTLYDMMDALLKAGQRNK